MVSVNRYRMARLLGRGGMAEVYDAFAAGENGFERRVALKKLAPELSADESFLHAFIDEARLMSQLHHPNIVSVFDFGVMDEAPFMAMEFIDGVDLSTLGERALSGVPLEIALYVGTELAHALEYAHHAKDARGNPLGVVHRDVSPQNILVSWEGRVALADFGIASAFRRLQSTRVGVVKGKLGYMSPEQERGEEVDGRADLFALGRVLEELIALEDEPETAAILARATAESAEDRFSSAAELAEALGRVLAKKLTRDPRSVMREWLSTIARDDTVPTPAVKRWDHLLDLELVVDAAERSAPSLPLDPAEAPVRRFESAVHREPEDATVFEALTMVVRAPESASEAEHDPLDPQTLLGAQVERFPIVSLVGRGGFADVYRARDPARGGREVALKILHKKYREASTLIGRMRREAQILSAIDHPNLVKVHQLDTTRDGRPYLVMELLRGETLAAIVVREAPLPHARVIVLVRQIALGLIAAHSAGVVHRDLKPGNIMVLEERSEAGEERVKILDFGIARIARSTQEALTLLTHGPGILGSPSHISPEQIRGASSVGSEADLYSLGVVLYQLLAGRVPFAARDRIELLRLHLTAAPPPIAGSGELGALALALLAKDPGARPDARAVLAWLESIDTVDTRESPTAVTAVKTQRVKIASQDAGSSRLRGVALGSLAIAALAIAFAAGRLTMTTPSPPPAEETPPPVDRAKPIAVSRDEEQPEGDEPEPEAEPEPAAKTAEIKTRAKRPPANANKTPPPSEERTAAPTPDHLLERLRHTHALITEKKSILDRQILSGLEKRYFSLRTAIRPDLSESRCRELAQELDALDSALNQ